MTSFPGKCVGRIPRKVLMAFQEAKMPWSGATPKRIFTISGRISSIFGPASDRSTPVAPICKNGFEKTAEPEVPL